MSEYPKKKKRPMTIWEYQKFCKENNFVMKWKNSEYWRISGYFFRFMEEDFEKHIKEYHYKLQDGTIREFEVEESF